jgi:hypothetical protein
MPEMTPPDAVQFLALAQLGAILAGFSSALILRLCGYRITRPG